MDGVWMVMMEGGGRSVWMVCGWCVDGVWMVCDGGDEEEEGHLDDEDGEEDQHNLVARARKLAKASLFRGTSNGTVEEEDDGLDNVVHGSSNGVNTEPSTMVVDEEGKKLLAEIDKVYAEKKNIKEDDAAADAEEEEGVAVATNENEGGEDEDADSESTPPRPVVESADGKKKEDGNNDASSVADTEATTPERETTATSDPPLMREWGSGSVEEQSQAAAGTTDDDAKKYQQQRGGLGLRGLGSRLKTMEEKMRERQQAFREQQQKLLAEQQRKEELERLNAAPGLSDVLMSKIASKSTHGNKDTVEEEDVEDGGNKVVKDDAAEGSLQDEQEEDPTSKNEATSHEEATTEPDSSDTVPSTDTLDKLSSEFTRRESNQALLLESVEDLEKTLLSLEPGAGVEGAATTGKTDNILTALSTSDASQQSSKGEVGGTDSKGGEPKAKSKGLMSRIHLPGRKKNKCNKESTTEEKKIDDTPPPDATVEDACDNKEESSPSTDKSKDLDTTHDLSDSDDDGFKEFIRIISNDELDREDSNSSGSATSNEKKDAEMTHIGTVVVQD